MFGRDDIYFDIPPGVKKTFLAILALALLGAAAWFAADYFRKEKSLPERAAQIVAAGRMEDCGKIRGSIDGVDYQTVCRNNIALKLALENLDFGSCSLLDEKLVTKESCEFEVLQKKISIAHDISICDSVPENFKAVCTERYWFDEARLKNDPMLCKKAVSAEEGVILCEEQLLMALALQDRGNLSCTSFSEDIRGDCAILKDILQNQAADAAQCGRLFSQSMQETCFYHLNSAPGR